MADRMGPPTKPERSLQEIVEDPLVEAEKELSKIIKDWRDGHLDMGDMAGLALTSDALYNIVRARMIGMEGGAQVTAIRQ